MRAPPRVPGCARVPSQALSVHLDRGLLSNVEGPDGLQAARRGGIGGWARSRLDSDDALALCGPGSGSGGGSPTAAVAGGAGGVLQGRAGPGQRGEAGEQGSTVVDEAWQGGHKPRHDPSCSGTGRLSKGSGLRGSQHTHSLLRENKPYKRPLMRASGCFPCELPSGPAQQRTGQRRDAEALRQRSTASPVGLGFLTKPPKHPLVASAILPLLVCPPALAPLIRAHTMFKSLSALKGNATHYCWRQLAFLSQ